MRSIRTPLFIALLLGSLPALAQPEERPLPPPGNGERMFGFEFEFAGRGNRIVHFEEMPWNNYRDLMRIIVEHHGGNPEHIRKVEFTKPTTNLERYPTGERPLFRAEWIDPRGRKWMIEPEYVASTGFDGYELVTPPIEDPRDLERLLQKLRDSGLVREGLKSGVHLNIDGRRLVSSNGDARALANLIIMHENMEPMLRRLFNPVRGGGHANRFARSLAVDHPDLLEEIDRLRPEERTRENLERLFRAREGREATLHEVDPMNPETRTKMWKYRAMNLAKVLNVNPMHNGNLGVVEFRMFDLDALKNPEIHRMEAEIYRRMVRHAEELAARGETVRYRPRAAMPTGENPSVYNTPDNPREARAEARGMIEAIGLNPNNYESLINERIQPRTLATEGEFRGLLDRIPGGRRTHNGAPFTFGFELEGRGNGLTGIMVPTDATVEARWDSMSSAEKKAYFDRVVTSDRSVKTHFKPDSRIWWLDPYWYVEGTGNWEIHSRVFESVDEIIRGMREAKNLTGKSGKGFHLHMRDNAPDWEMLRTRGSNFADWIERASNWVWLERARRLGTMTSLKSWSNARMTTSDVDNLANMRSSSRATIRTQISSPNYIDIEIRGFTKYVSDIETLAKLTTEALKTGNFGPWRHTDNVLPNGGRGAAPESLRLVDHVERYLTEVEGKTMTPEMRRVVEGMQKDYLNRSGVNARTLPTNLATPLLPWEAEASLPEDVRRALTYERETYLRKVANMAREIADGTRYGMDLNVASERALAERLGISPEAARGLVAYRRANGNNLTAEAAVNAVASGENIERLARMESFNLSNGEVESLRNRFNISEADARRIVEHGRGHEVLEALERAGVPENRILEMVDRTGEVNLATTELSPERLANRLGISEAAARRILEARAGHEINNANDVRSAGIEEARANEIVENARRTADLRTANADELRRLGLNDSEVERLTSAREANTLRRYNDLDRAGVSNSVRESLRGNNNINLNHLNTLSASEIVERAGISMEDANRIVRHRSALDISNAETLNELLGSERAEAVRGRAANGLNLNTASEAELRAAGLSESEARRVVNHRSETRIGYPPNSTYGSFSADRAADFLLENRLVTEAEAESIRRNAGASDLERATAETLRERFGLEESRARRVINFRDAHDMNNLENLRNAGLSEAEAERLLRESRGLDARNATRAEIMERTGLSEAEVNRLLAVRGTNLSTITAEALAERAGVSLENARRIIEHREARGAMDVENLVERGVDRATAERLVESARPFNVMEATLEELTRRGLSESEARRIIEIREKAKNVEGLDLKEIERQLRFKVKLWARNTQLSEALRRSLLPRITEANPVVDTPENRAEGRYTESNNARAEGEGFSRARRGAAGPVVESRIGESEIRGIFENVRETSINRTLARMTNTETTAAERAALETGMRNLRGLGLEVVKTNDILAEYSNNKVRVSTGLLNEIHTRVEAMPADARGFMRSRILGLIMAHETSHSAGIRAERVADAEAIGIVEGSNLSRVGEGTLKISNPELRTAIEAFDRPLGSSHLDNFLNRMRNLIRYGTTRGRLENMERAARGEADKFARYRRVDGTLNWKRMTADGVLKHGVGGTAHFALALFLKEVAMVVQTGDRARIEEFFDGLMTTDFYVHYGLFVAGARIGDVAYVRYLQKYVKPKFINGLLRTNLTLAAGLALPMIVEGNFEGKAFAITLGSLGLSTAAVRTGVRSIKWVKDLATARRTGTLARVGVRAGRMSNVVGWFYTAAELAVILYVAEKIERDVHARMDLGKARDTLADAGREFLDAVNADDASVDSVREATKNYHDAWIGYRNYLYTPMEMEEGIYAERLARLAREAKIKADEREAALERIRDRAALRASIERRYGSLEAYADHLTKRDEDALREDLETYSESYNINREKHLAEVYNDHRRGTNLLDDVEHLDWNLAGGVAGAEGDPLGERNDVFANFSRDRARAGLEDALGGGASRNRLESYGDEAAILSAVAESLRERGNDAFAAVIMENVDIVNATLAADRNLANGNPTIDTEAIRAGAAANSAGGSAGMGERVEGAADEGE